MSKRSKYTPEFRSEVVALCQLGDRSRAQVARDLGLNYHTLMVWLRDAATAKNQGPEVLILSEKEELKRLRKENWSCSGLTDT